MIGPNHFEPALLEIEARAQAFPSRESLTALRGAGVRDRLIGDLAITEARVKFHPHRRWDYDNGGRGVSALLLTVENAYGEVVDVVAWPVAAPEQWGRLTGRSVLLGESELNAAAMDEPVPVWRTPLAWLASGCQGIVILDPTYAWRRLVTGPPLSGEDLEHAREIRRALTPPNPTKIYVRTSAPRKAAAA